MSQPKRKSFMELQREMQLIRQNERLMADNMNRLMANLQQRPMLPIESEEARAQRYREIELRRERPRLPPNLPEEPDDYDYDQAHPGNQVQQGNEYWTYGTVSDDNYWGYINHQGAKANAKKLEQMRLEHDRQQREWRRQQEEWRKQQDEWGLFQAKLNRQREEMKEEQAKARESEDEFNLRAQQREKDMELKRIEAMKQEMIMEDIAAAAPQAPPPEDLASLRRGKRPTIPPPPARSRAEAAPPPRREGPLSAEEHTAYNLKPTGGTADPGHRQKRDTYWEAQNIAWRHFQER